MVKIQTQTGKSNKLRIMSVEVSVGKQDVVTVVHFVEIFDRCIGSAW